MKDTSATQYSLRTLTWWCVSGMFLVGLYGGLANADEKAIRAQFHPYSQSAPQLPGLEPGVTLTAANVHLAREVLPAELVQLVTAGDLALSIHKTTDLPPRATYLDATIQHSQSVALQNSGVLAHYHAGAPFPLVDAADPQAGEKIAWNLRYRDLGEAFELRANPQQLNTNGGVEHSNRGHMKIRFGMHRPNPADNIAQWQEQGVYMKNSFELLAPSDQEGIISLRTFYDDDTRQTEQWRYSPQNRRTRKDTVNYVTPIGGYYGMLQEEQPPFFFQGYVHEYQWHLDGQQVMLVPGFLDTPAISYGGKYGWYPQIPWELRRVYVLSCTPRNSHPFGKRVFFLDQQTYTPLLAISYDAQGAFVRLMIAGHATPHGHPGSNGVLLPMLVGAAWINYAKAHATLFTTGDTMIFNPPLAAQRFELMEILRKGK